MSHPRPLTVDEFALILIERFQKDLKAQDAYVDEHARKLGRVTLESFMANMAAELHGRGFSLEGIPPLVDAIQAAGKAHTILVPSLDHDAMMREKFGHEVSANGRLERRIVAALCAHLGALGWSPFIVDDGDRKTPVHDTKSAMELLFNLDDAWLGFNKDGREHYVRLVFGNGVGVVSDWTFTSGDVDGFNAALDSFESSEFA